LICDLRSFISATDGHVIQDTKPITDNLWELRKLAITVTNNNKKEKIMSNAKKTAISEKHESRKHMHDALVINRDMLGKGETKSRLYINEQTLVYIAVFDMAPAKYRKKHGLKKDQNLLEIANAFELSLIDEAQIKNKELLLGGMTYSEREPKVVKHVADLKAVATRQQGKKQHINGVGLD